ncbi:MAG TPA: alpha-2-macroglobulin [Stellaceae bacterium]|jgi:hypothetical protein|nr:alpha-2-macroglobulin [Stellaceae bacterium]
MRSSSSQWIRAAFFSLLLALCPGLSTSSYAADAAKPPLIFQHVTINASSDITEACFHFSETLDSRAEAHYSDYVAVEPALTPSLRASGSDLCLGGLAYGTDYRITLRQGLPAKSGARIAADETVPVTLGDRAPLVAVSGDGFILPRAEGKGIAIQTVNVGSVKIHVLRMSDKLLPSQLGGASRFDYRAKVLSSQSLNRYQLHDMLRGSLSLVWSGTMEVHPDHNRTVETAFPLGDAVKPGQVGAYLIVAEDAAHALPEKFFNTSAANDDNDNFGQLWEPIAAHWVVSTDIALTAVSGSDGLHVFARSLASAEPLSDIKLSLIATGQDVLGQGATGAGGHFVFAPGLMRGKGASAAANVVAYGAAGGDFAILNLNRAAFDLSDRGVSGRAAAGAVEAFLYTERGVYRPGQSVEVMTLLRDRTGRAVPNMGLTLVLRRPDGVEANRFAMAAQPVGGFHRSISLSATAPRGLWSLEAYIDPSGNAIGRVQFDVEDFVPQQLKVTLNATTPVLRPGEPIAATVDGAFLYGAPAAGLTGEAELRITRDLNPVPGAKDYQFGLVEDTVEDDVQKLSLPNADEQGRTKIDDVVKAPKVANAPLKGVLTAGLFDPGGRIVQDQIELPIRTQPLLIGIKPRFADGRAEEGKQALFDIRVFDAAGKPTAHTGLEWRLVRENRVYDWFHGGNNEWVWLYHVVDHPEASGTVDVGDNVATLNQRVDWGYYRLIVDDPATQVATSVRFQAGWRETAESADTPDQVKVTVQKAGYQPGATARIHVDAPFAGKAELTIAGDRVFETRAVTVPKGGAVFDVKVGADWGAGAYAVLSLYRPLDQGRPRDPVRAVGVAWLSIDAKPHTLSVAIGAPEKTIPRQQIAVPLKLTGAKTTEPVYVTLAAVDEGILQLTRFKTPDPADFFFGKRRLGIDIRDDYGRLLDNSAALGRLREGGDAAIGGAPLPVVSTRTVALFSGPVRVAANGTARVMLDVPDFEGQLRLMAVAYSANAVGRGEGKLIVRDPVIADLSLPRFLAPGDSARLALQLTNTDGVAGAYHLTLKSSGAAEIAFDHALDYSLGAGEHKSDAVTLIGKNEGVASISADLTGPNGYEVHRKWQIAVRSPHYPITIEDTALQAHGTSYQLEADKLKPFVPGSVTVSLGYSGFAGIDVPSLLQSLYQYPFGCTEQMASVAFPLIYFKDPALLGRVPQEKPVADRVQNAINTILDREDASGEFGLWRAGDGEASPWLNVYALDFLVHAKEAGFIVPDGALQRSYNYIQQATRRLDQNNQGYYAQSASATHAYAAFVLARAGRADLGELRRMHDALVWQGTADDITAASVHWSGGRTNDTVADPMSLGYLAGALALMHDHARAMQTFALASANLDNDAYEHLYPHWWFDIFYATPIRDRAALAAIAAEAGETDTAVALIQHLRNVDASYADHLNTQEKAWLLRAAFALGKNTNAVSLTINGQRRDNITLPLALAPSNDEIAAGYTVENSGARDVWRTLVIRGAPLTAPAAMAAGYTISKHYFTLDGQPLDPAHLKQNDRLIVSLAGRAADRDPHRTALVDMLPAGWEIEALVTREETYSFLGALTKASTIEARDDRFVAAFNLNREGNGRYVSRDVDSAQKSLDPADYHVAYVVRVVTPGHFVLPEAEIEDMYRPGVMARSDAGETTADAR